MGKTQSLHCKKGSFKQVISHRVLLSHLFLFPTVLKINAPTITLNRQIVLLKEKKQTEIKQKQQQMPSEQENEITFLHTPRRSQ